MGWGLEPLPSLFYYAVTELDAVDYDDDRDALTTTTRRKKKRMIGETA
jgi:hypothetical protein